MRTKTQYFICGLLVLAIFVILGFYTCQMVDDARTRPENQSVEYDKPLNPNMERALESLAASWREENRNRK